METIGITGGIGSGKSVVSRILRCNGCYVYDCDSEAKRLMREAPEVVEKLKTRLGADIYNSDGSLNKTKIADLIYKDSEKRNFVNQIVHGAVRRDIKEKREQVDGLFFIESAIIATGGIAPECSRIWLVTSPEEIRILRVEKRDGLSRREIERRMEAQEKELSLLPEDKIIILENDDVSGLVYPVMSLIEKNHINQTYKVLC